MTFPRKVFRTAASLWWAGRFLTSRLWAGQASSSLLWAGLVSAALILGAPASAAGQAAPDSARAGEIEAASGGGGTLIPIPIIFYSPETEFAAGASVLYLFGGNEPGTHGRPSSLSAVTIYTQKKQLVLGGGGNLLLDGGTAEITGGLSYMDFPTEFYGVGNNTPESGVEDYDPRRFQASLRATRRVRGPFQVGVTALAAHLDLRDVAEGGLLDQGRIPGAAGGWSVGFGLLAGVDTRDAVYSPLRGAFAEVGAEVYDSVFGSDYGFTRYRADFRRYTPLFANHVFATRVLGIFSLGDAPFQLMPQLGGSELLRGYYEGRFRERDLLALQAEYRFPLYGPVALAFFASAGQVAHRAPEFRIDAFHLGGGLGLRYLLSRESRLTLRVDEGFGEEGSGFYFSFGEAF